jgi:hypothetical protein
MDLTKTMRIEVTTILTAAPVAGDRPQYLPAGCEWPLPDGKRIMYSFGSSEYCVCSECITNDDVVKYTADYYMTTTGRLRQVSRGDNCYWHCNARRRDDGRRNCGGKAGTRL